MRKLLVLFFVGLMVCLSSPGIFAATRAFVYCLPAQPKDYGKKMKRTATRQDVVGTDGVFYGISNPKLTQIACDRMWGATLKQAENNPGDWGFPVCIKKERDDPCDAAYSTIPTTPIKWMGDNRSCHKC